MSNITLQKKKRQRKNTKNSRTFNTRDYRLTVKSVKKKNDIEFEVWQLNWKGDKEKVKTFEFRKDAKKLADFHNEFKVWKVNGGLPKFLLD